MAEQLFSAVYDSETKAEIAALLGGEPREVTGETLYAHPELLRDVEILMASWGLCPLDGVTMPHANKLRAVFYAGGTVRYFAKEAFWARNIPLTSAAYANGIPVAEYTFAQIILCLKRFYFHADAYKNGGDYSQHEFAGTYKSRVGLISYGHIARHVRKLLADTAVEVCVFSPELDAASAAAEGMTYLSLADIFKTCDVVSLHTPLLPQTTGMIGGRHFLSMRENAAFINTARGAVIDEAEMTAALKTRGDVTAVLDVTAEEPLPLGHGLFGLKNAVLTPHIAGSYFNERRRLGQLAREELESFLKGGALRYPITEKMLDSIG
jgi:phosphoglycerate dehydrogenase-like enzyme